MGWLLFPTIMATCMHDLPLHHKLCFFLLSSFSLAIAMSKHKVHKPLKPLVFVCSGVANKLQKNGTESKIFRGQNLKGWKSEKAKKYSSVVKDASRKRICVVRGQCGQICRCVWILRWKILSKFIFEAKNSDLTNQKGFYSSIKVTEHSKWKEMLKRLCYYPILLDL